MARSLGADGNTALGLNLKRIRDDLDIDQGDAAVQAELADNPRSAQNLLSAWENGRQTPSVDGLLKLAVLYGSPLDEFFHGVDDRYDKIIQQEIAPDHVAHYQARENRMTAMMQAMVRTAAARPGAVPTGATTGAGTRVARGKSKVTPPRRARAAKKKP